MENEEKVLTENDENTSSVSVLLEGEEKTFTPEEIAGFIEKSEKFDLIDSEYNRLKGMADKASLSVEEFLNSLENRDKENRRTILLQKCSGDEELADYILGLEEKNSSKTDAAFIEVQRYFPNIKNIDEIPSEVFKAASVKGSNLLNEYLRYLQLAKLTLKAFEKNNIEAKLASVGSQREAISQDFDPAKLQFIKGIWNK
ncbi:MAG: hypothetical protein PUF48_01225 [Oscillospiraceae bacterium]|nr:hypothetical protein [Oscillospiraceae bacterium]